MVLKTCLKVVLTFHQRSEAKANPIAKSDVIVMGLVWAQGARILSCPLLNSQYSVENLALRNF